MLPAQAAPATCCGSEMLAAKEAKVDGMVRMVVDRRRYVTLKKNLNVCWHVDTRSGQCKPAQRKELGRLT